LNLERLELDVYIDNEAAVHLYKKFGFVIEGTSYYSYIIEKILAPLAITRVRLGRTLLPYRLADEVRYHSQYQGTTVFDGSGTTVPSPYGAWNLENMDSHGALLASAVDVVRFATAFDTPAASPILD
jgi:hypothetical protein